MPLGARGSSADAPNLVNITNAVYDIALNQSGVSWGSSKQWDFPTAAQLAAGSKPYLVVTWPKLAAYAWEGRPAGKELVREIGGATSEFEPIWDINVWGIYDFDANNAQTYSTPHADLALLHQAFTIFYGVEDTCDRCNIVDPHFAIIQTTPSEKFAAITMTIRCYELLIANYTQPDP